ncbi:hypothetical protein KI688_009852 [Linnemannia hyalina]|uniref:Uncharacterized protein n=1 Tax=Linnemannia hyalina TaxID=64524 RepID=A0A9P7XYK5_9FUNG|nr:hypothetical protein KI688_009852 [Linnemannia hyalina]
MEQPSDIIPHLSTDLRAIHDGLQTQLQGLSEVLAHRNLFIYNQTTQHYTTLVDKFMHVLQQYLDNTLLDLFRVIDNISSLMRIYDRDLDIFIHHKASTISGVESCIQKVEALIDQHSNTISELSITSFEIAELIKEYEAEADNHSNGSVTAKIVSASLAVTGAVASAGLAVMAPPFAIGTFVLLAGGGGGISGLISLHDQHKSDIYTTAAANLNIVQRCSEGLQAPISAIYKKLGSSKQSLLYIKDDTSTATSDNQPDFIRRFASIGGTRALHNGSPAPDRDDNLKWNVSDLLRGITPKSMLAEWSTVFRTPMSIAKTVLHKFVSYLETQALELIWKARSSETIAWEQTQGISAKDKTSKYTGPEVTGVRDTVTSPVMVFARVALR